MNRLLSSGILLFALVSIVVLSSCAMMTRKMYRLSYKFNADEENEVIINQALADFISNNPKPSFVLRTDAVTYSITQEEKKAEYYYGIVERTLLKHGFTVRDRSLLNTVMPGKGSYRDIAKSIETDLILEIQSVDLLTKDIYEFEIPSTGYSGDLRNFNYEENYQIQRQLGPIAQNYLAIEFKVILVKTGELGGYFKLLYSEDTQEFFGILNQKKDKPVPGTVDNMLGWHQYDIKYRSLILSQAQNEKNQLEDAFEELTRKLLIELDLIQK